MVGTTEAQDLFRKSYKRGLVVFFYGLLWLIAVLAAFIWLDSFFAASGSLSANLIVATWSAALAGGLGGATAMLSRLYHHLSIKQDFQNQSIFAYVVQPFIGLFAGVIVLYLISIPIALFVNFALTREILFAEVLAASSFMATQILIAWIAGFYQRRGLDRIKSFARRSADNEQLAALAGTESLDENAPLFFKAWFRQRRQMIRWSYTWGVFLLIYAVTWIVGFLLIFLASGGIAASLESSSNTTATGLILAAWPAAAAGGLGGACSLLYDLYRHVSIEQDFHRQHLMSYLVQPLIGFVFGLVIYLLLTSGYLIITNEGGSTNVVEPPIVVMLQLLLGWIAGFRQQYITDWTQRFIQRVIALVKSSLVFFHPRNWFDKARRDEALKRISEEADLFKVTDADESTASS